MPDGSAPPGPPAVFPPAHLALTELERLRLMEGALNFIMGAANVDIAPGWVCVPAVDWRRAVEAPLGAGKWQMTMVLDDEAHPNDERTPKPELSAAEPAWSPPLIFDKAANRVRVATQADIDGLVRQLDRLDSIRRLLQRIASMVEE